MINLNLKKQKDLPKTIVISYKAQYTPEEYLFVNLTSNFEAKQFFQEEIMDIIREPWHILEDNATTTPVDKILGMMPIPKPHKLNITSAQRHSFEEIIKHKKDVFTDPFGTTYQVVKLQDFPYTDIPPGFITYAPMDNRVHSYRNGFYNGYLEATKTINKNDKQEDFYKTVFLQVIDPDLMTVITNSNIYHFWFDLGHRHGQHYCMWQYIISNHHKFNSFFVINSANESVSLEPANVVMTKKEIAEIFNTMGSKGTFGWQYAFFSKTDYDVIFNLLVNHFTNSAIELPDTIITLRPHSKTQMAKSLHSIFKELGEDLHSDSVFFSIVKLLAPFSNMSNEILYTTLTRR